MTRRNMVNLQPQTGEVSMRWAGVAVALCVAAGDRCGADDLPAPRKPMVIANDNGGILQNYLERYQTQVALGATFRIDGRCRSACTLVLLWADRVCATERAALGFHQVRDESGQRSQSGSDFLMSLYPAPVREYISSHGGLPPPWGTMWVSGPALRSLVKPCE